jgi:hypothetical protein
MKDHLTALTEAVRLARLEIGCFRDQTCRATAEWHINRLDRLLSDRKVDEAMAVFASEAQSPSIVPDITRQTVKH